MGAEKTATAEGEKKSPRADENVKIKWIAPAWTVNEPLILNLPLALKALAAIPQECHEKIITRIKNKCFVVVFFQFKATP